MWRHPKNFSERLGRLQQDQLVALRQLAPGAAGLASFIDGLRLSPSMYFTYAEHNRSFQSLGVWITATANVTVLFTDLVGSTELRRPHFATLRDAVAAMGRIA